MFIKRSLFVYTVVQISSVRFYVKIHMSKAELFNMSFKIHTNLYLRLNIPGLITEVNVKHDIWLLSVVLMAFLYTLYILPQQYCVDWIYIYCWSVAVEPWCYWTQGFIDQGLVVFIFNCYSPPVGQVYPTYPNRVPDTHAVGYLLWQTCSNYIDCMDYILESYLSTLSTECQWGNKIVRGSNLPRGVPHAIM